MNPTLISLLVCLLMAMNEHKEIEIFYEYQEGSYLSTHTISFAISRHAIYSTTPSTNLYDCAQGCMYRNYQEGAKVDS